MASAPNIIKRDNYTGQQTVPPNNTAEGWGYWDTMEEAPGAAAYGIGYAWIGGRPYWSNGASWQLQGVVQPLFGESDVLFLGDSRLKAGTQTWIVGATGSGTSGLEVVGFEDSSQTLLGAVTSGTGSLDYDGPNKLVRWRAPADAANGYGPWTSVRPLEQVWLESYSSKNRLLVSGRKAAAWKTQTDSVSVSSSPAVVNYPKLRTTWPAILGYDQMAIPWLATGGEMLEAVAEALEWAADAYSTRKCWVVWSGINNINTGTPYITSGVAAINQIVAKAKKYGATVLFVGNHCEWGASVGTAITAQQIADFKTIESAMISAANSNTFVYYVDIFPTSIDRTDTTNSFKPITSPTKLLIDTVHPTSYGGQVFAEKFASDYSSIFVPKKVSPYFDDNRMAHGMFNTGTSGSASAGASGTVATGWSATCTGGASAVCSIVDNPYGPGKAMKLDMTSTTAGSVVLNTNNSGLQAIGALGKAAGQAFRVAYEIADLTAAINYVLGYGRQYSSGPTNLGVNYQTWASLNDLATQSDNLLAAFTGRRRYYSPWRKSESTLAFIYAFVEIYIPASYTGSMLVTFVGIY